ncbi:MAG: hypothetical protein ABSC03_04035 [Verrucomicrobiota bacterium]|jgi:hypothetical protein
MSGIDNRLGDALLLWKTGRREGAFLSALIAVAAAARRRYPTLKDREAFEKFLADCHTVRISVEYRGECHPVEHIFYKWLRCQLVHEGGLPPDIRFTKDSEPGSMSVRAGGAPEFILKIGTGWFSHMIASVQQAPENADQCRGN